MSRKNRLKNMNAKQKSRRMFLGMLMPLLVLTFVACTFFYIITSKLLDNYLSKSLSNSIEEFNSGLVERMSPIITNVNNFSNFAALTDDVSVLQPLLTVFSHELEYSSSLYYASTVSRFEKDGIFLESSGWIPPKDFDPSSRGWFKAAMENPGTIAYSTPYIDVQTGELSVTISRTIKDSTGKVKGVLGCDILLNTLLDLLTEMQVTKNGSVNLITKDGFYMTNKEPSKIMTANYFTETNFPLDINTWMDGEKRTSIGSKKYYGICEIGNAPWYVVVDGPVRDMKDILSKIVISFELFMILFSFVSAIFNINTVREMRKEEELLGADLFEETQTLVVAAKENAATAQDQSAAVKEIVATMEDSNALSENIATKIRDVSKVAEKTSIDVASGVASIQQNVAQLHAIFDANQQTIDGMKILSERIESIWDIVTLINNVADQAKIIAFNAELEASSAGEAGKSFRIVANEIRRLSDGIIDGTKEIKERINEIQHSSDSLILASESGTEKINEGYENAKSLGEMFASIKNSAEVTAGSAGDITDIIQQQTNASEQILIALRQISAGVENFTVATDNISASSEHIRSMSESLNKSVQTATDKDKKEKA